MDGRRAPVHHQPVSVRGVSTTVRLAPFHPRLFNELLDREAINTFLNDDVSLVVRIPLAVVLLGVSAYLARTGLHTVFGETRDKPGVIRTGVFGIVRHPIYLSEILLCLGLLTLSISLAAAVVWCGAIVFLYFISRWEEKLLLVRFGEAYAQYMRDVPRKTRKSGAGMRNRRKLVGPMSLAH